MLHKAPGIAGKNPGLDSRHVTLTELHQSPVCPFPHLENENDANKTSLARVIKRIKWVDYRDKLLEQLVVHINLVRTVVMMMMEKSHENGIQMINIWNTFYNSYRNN